MGPVETSRPRIAILLRSLSPGGAERQAVLTARELKARGHDVTLLTFYGGGAFEQEARRADIPVVELGKAGRWDLWRTWRTLVRHLKASQADVLYAYTPTPNLLALSCKLRLPSLPVVWGIRAADMDLCRYGRVSRLVFAIGAWLSRFADAIVVNSRSGQRHHAAHGYAAERMRVIPNGIDVVRFAPDPAAGAALRRSIGVPADAVLIGVVARLDPMKDHGTFLRAASQLLAVRPDVRFVCVGDGPADRTSSLRALAGELGIADRVLWLGHRSDTPAVYNALTLLTSSSISEGFSNSIAEAMACGTPVVATDAGDSAWLVGSTGLIVPAGNAEQLKDAWVRMLDGRVESSGRAARDRVAAAFSVAAMVTATTQTFQDVIRYTGASLDLSTISPTGR